MTHPIRALGEGWGTRIKNYWGAIINGRRRDLEAKGGVPPATYDGGYVQRPTWVGGSAHGPAVLDKLSLWTTSTEASGEEKGHISVAEHVPGMSNI